jgi:hypothetical protein
MLIAFVATACWSLKTAIYFSGKSISSGKLIAGFGAIMLIFYLETGDKCS